jgi:formylglycine-generating enzyme required for sulfatase activity
LSLRQTCSDAASEIACNDDVNEFSVAPGVTQQLSEGRYFLLVGNQSPNPMSLTLVFKEALDETRVELTPVESSSSGDPRLFSGDTDVTPASEPQPSLAIDRLAQLRVSPTERSTAYFLLRGDCIGTMADIEDGRGCFDTEGQLLPVGREPMTDGLRAPPDSRVGTWSGYASATDCDEPPEGRTVEEAASLVCIPAGSLTLGDTTVIGVGARSALPERLITVSPFHVDRYEYTVGRYRRALSRGFVPDDTGPHANDAEMGNSEALELCTWNSNDDAGDALFPQREDYPLNCLTWGTARALCAFDGGDLPTFAERESLAGASLDEAETLYPSGNVRPTCNTMVYGRSTPKLGGSSECAETPVEGGAPGGWTGIGPMDVSATPFSDSDVTPRGVVGLGGNVAEWTLDSHQPYSGACWASQSLLDPCCFETEAPERSVAGASFRDTPGDARSAARRGAPPSGLANWIGFRCVYRNHPLNCEAEADDHDVACETPAEEEEP